MFSRALELTEAGTFRYHGVREYRDVDYQQHATPDGDPDLGNMDVEGEVELPGDVHELTEYKIGYAISEDMETAEIALTVDDDRPQSVELTLNGDSWMFDQHVSVEDLGADLSVRLPGRRRGRHASAA